MSVCLDSWVVIAWLDGHQPAMARVESAIVTRPVISWINLAEVYYRVERQRGREAADTTPADLRERLVVDLPLETLIVDAARLKAKHAIAFADCFALATATHHGLTLWTGDPEILNMDNPPCELEDLRGD